MPKNCRCSFTVILRAEGRRGRGEKGERREGGEGGKEGTEEMGGVGKVKSCDQTTLMSCDCHVTYLSNKILCWGQMPIDCRMMSMCLRILLPYTYAVPNVGSKRPVTTDL